MENIREVKRTLLSKHLKREVSKVAELFNDKRKQSKRRESSHVEANIKSETNNSRINIDNYDKRETTEKVKQL